MSDPSQLEFRKPSRLARFTGVAGEVMLTIGALAATLLLSFAINPIFSKKS